MGSGQGAALTVQRTVGTQSLCEFKVETTLPTATNPDSLHSTSPQDDCLYPSKTQPAAMRG